ncbi:hypothetical protein [Streptomyces sp. NPDC000188]
MWAPAASVLLGAWYLTTRTKGLVWPSPAPVGRIFPDGSRRRA